MVTSLVDTYLSNVQPHLYHHKGTLYFADTLTPLGLATTHDRDSKGIATWAESNQTSPTANGFRTLFTEDFTVMHQFIQTFIKVFSSGKYP